MTKKLRGRVVEVKRTGEFIEINGERWEKCIFVLELTSFSKGTLRERLPPSLKGKKVNLLRYCLYDWHYKTGVEKTLEPDETEAVLKGKPTSSVWW